MGAASSSWAPRRRRRSWLPHLLRRSRSLISLALALGLDTAQFRRWGPPQHNFLKPPSARSDEPAHGASRVVLHPHLPSSTLGRQGLRRSGSPSSSPVVAVLRPEGKSPDATRPAPPTLPPAPPSLSSDVCEWMLSSSSQSSSSKPPAEERELQMEGRPQRESSPRKRTPWRAQRSRYHYHLSAPSLHSDVAGRPAIRVAIWGNEDIYEPDFLKVSVLTIARATNQAFLRFLRSCETVLVVLNTCHNV